MEITQYLTKKPQKAKFIINCETLSALEKIRNIIDEQNKADSNGNHVSYDEIINESILMFYLQLKSKSTKITNRTIQDFRELISFEVDDLELNDLIIEAVIYERNEHVYIVFDFPDFYEKEGTEIITLNIEALRKCSLLAFNLPAKIEFRRGKTL